MRPRDSLLSSSTDDLWSLVSFDDDISEDVLAVDEPVDYNDDNDDEEESVPAGGEVHRQRDDLPRLPLATTTTTTTKKSKSAKLKATKSVVRRNERERNRVKQVNQGFDRLRQYVRLPGLSKKKLSKVDTLRAAVDYIKQLQSLLAEADDTAAAAANTSPHHLIQQLLPSQSTPFYSQPPPSLEHSVDDVTGLTSGLVFLSRVSVGPSAEPCDVDKITSGLLVPTSTVVEPTIGSTYSVGSECLPLVDVNENDYFVTSTSVSQPIISWSPEDALVNTHVTDANQQQRRLSELTAWLMQ